MASETLDAQGVWDRLEYLQRQNRWLRGTVILTLALVGSLVLMAQAAPRSRTVQAERFVLIDSESRPAAVLSADGGEPGLVLRGQQSEAAFILTSDGGNLTISNGKSTSGLILSNEGPKLALLRSGGQDAGAVLGMNNDAPMLALTELSQLRG